jgi:3,4-dihydroxy 2-butanone 4-phosphate synthase
VHRHRTRSPRRPGVAVSERPHPAAATDHPVLERLLPDDIQYDASKPAFGLTLNHRDTYTGITDEDRSRTITQLAHLADAMATLSQEAARQRLGQEFRSPGHVILLNGAPGGLAARQGHTELSLALAHMAGLPGSTTVCEMMDPQSGHALARRDAEAYAEAHGLAFLTGQDVMQAWRNAQGSASSPAPTYA